MFCGIDDTCDGGGNCKAGSTLNFFVTLLIISSALSPCDGNPVCNNTCNEQARTCSSPQGIHFNQIISHFLGIQCDDGLHCTIIDACDGQGQCVGTQSPCPDPSENPCRGNSCINQTFSSSINFDHTDAHPLLACQETNTSFACIAPAGTPCQGTLT